MPKGSKSGQKEKQEEKGAWVIEEDKEWLPKPEYWMDFPPYYSK